MDHDTARVLAHVCETQDRIIRTLEALGQRVAPLDPDRRGTQKQIVARIAWAASSAAAARQALQGTKPRDE